MNMRSLGQSDIQITPIIIGTWQAGKRGWVGIEDQEVIRGLRAAVEAGINTIDTAEVYGEGYSEQIVGQALSDVRSQVVYATKVFANHLKYDQVIAACEGSLKNLRTDYIDLYQIHWPSGSFNSEIVPIDETMRALNDLKQQGKIRAIGVSNFSVSQLEEARQYGQIDSVQPPYSLFWRQIEQELLPYCAKHQISILAYSSLAQGLLTGKFGPDTQLEKGDVRLKNKLFQGETFNRVQSALAALRPVAEQHHCTLAQLALAWLIAQPQTCAIAGARNAEQASQNARAMSVQLTAADLNEIDAISRQVTDTLDDNPLMWDFAS